MNKKDKRMHLTVADRGLQDQITHIMDVNNLTHEEFLKKYLKFPIDEFDIATEKFNEFEKCYRSCVQNENIEDINRVLDYSWMILANIANGLFSADAYIKAVDANLDSESYLAIATDKEHSFKR